MSYLTAAWGKIPAPWKDRLYGAAAASAGAYGGPAAKELAEVLIGCLRAHYGV